MKHLGILATTPEGAALCLRVFCEQAMGEPGPQVTLDCIALARAAADAAAGPPASAGVARRARHGLTRGRRRLRGLAVSCCS
jgi:hypothetical protein